MFSNTPKNNLSNSFFSYVIKKKEIDVHLY